MNDKAELGRRGEIEVGRYLQERGHIILERNWRFSHLEIDLITLAEDGIHFVEVKSRRSMGDCAPQDAVNALKQRRVWRAAKRYLALNSGKGFEAMEAWLDVAAVVFRAGDVEIEYFPAAYVPIIT